MRKADALALIRELGAPPRLVRHVELVGEAGDAILRAVAEAGVEVDVRRVEVGIVFHDVGKVRFPAELDEPGHAHEEAGEKMLLEAGVDPVFARSCVSHARWAAEGVSLEEQLVALADKLWKGKRETALEALVVDEIARRRGRDRWDVFPLLDDAFERIAGGADERLSLALNVRLAVQETFSQTMAAFPKLLPFALVGALACGGATSPPPNPAKTPPDSAPTGAATPDASAPARALVPLHEPTTRRVATWSLNEVPPDDARGETIGASAFSDLVLPRERVLARQADFAVDLGAALDHIDALAKRAVSDAKPAMEADLSARAARAPKGSNARGREDTIVIHAQLARDHGTLTISIWSTLRKHIEGPIVKAPQANCAPGQPCAQQADQRSDATVTETFGARYVVKSDGSFEEILYLAQGAGP